MRKGKRRIVLVLLYFIVAIMCFGILSRAISLASVPMVSVATPSADEVVVEGEPRPYLLCLPTAAVYQDEGAPYVYVVEPRAGFSGDEWRARRVNVIVTDQDEDMVALAEGSLSSSQQVVVATTKMIGDGAAVRIAGE